MYFKAAKFLGYISAVGVCKYMSTYMCMHIYLCLYKKVFRLVSHTKNLLWADLPNVL